MKTVIEMAREAEFPAANYPALVADGEWEALERFAELVRAEALAEESRTFGLRLDDWAKIGCVNHDCDKCKAQRKPLTNEEIWKFWWSRPEVPEGEDDSMEAEFVAAVRQVLAAHGIKENT